MKPYCQSTGLVIPFLVVIGSFALGNGTGLAKPRPPAIPLPSVGLIHTECFDQPYWQQGATTIDPSVRSESFSGYCLERGSPLVVPWAIPVTVTNRALVDGYFC